MRATSGPVARPGVKGGEKASERSHGERGSVDETLDNLLWAWPNQDTCNCTERESTCVLILLLILLNYICVCVYKFTRYVLYDIVKHFCICLFNNYYQYHVPDSCIHKLNVPTQLNRKRINSFSMHMVQL